MTYNAVVPQRTKETNISGFTLECYQHPPKHAFQTPPYRYEYDVYALGMLLFKVGL
ncbi:uncharacterized protein CC84DRAFT_1168760 [Paraphaeosphaeria sporulosa]|uniref:Protein kinase domain-containing protein n=1 Tax=Paraphaeosphaeria sporulosa TaxID=1460663 RepID=A0A177C259_9PLEO|nr:uncharacterized protein CC84DRAFT_1168760 [Paraphaeosphaeria sporulosa]OAG00720.1 hypothetical protein CC84DRAFT_1168760 [Paraphaeosphaeria sporulosa]